jgi:hypothetical protein
MNLKTICKKKFNTLISNKFDNMKMLDVYIKNTFNLSTTVIFNKNKIK